jgi:hypothetical protein
MKLFYRYGAVLLDQIYEARKNRITGTVTVWFGGEWCPIYPEHYDRIAKTFKEENP